MTDDTEPSVKHVTIDFSYDNVEQEHVRVADALLTFTDAELGYWLRQTIANTVLEGPQDERVRNIYIDHVVGKHNHCTPVFCKVVRERIARREARLRQLQKWLEEPAFVAGQGDVTVIALECDDHI